MFLYSVKSKSEAASSSYLSSDQRVKNYFDDIVNGRYHIAVSFSKEDETLLYEAYEASNPLSDRKPYFAIAIDASGNAYSRSSKMDMDTTALDFSEKALYVFIFRLEKKLAEEDEDKLPSFYSKFASELKPLLGLNEKERTKRREIRKDFLDFMSYEQEPKRSASDENLFVPDVQLSLQYNLRDNNGSPVLNFDILMGEKKLFSPRNLMTFFSAIAEQTPYSFTTGKRMIISYDLFDESSRRALLFLSNIYLASLNNYYRDYRANDFVFSVASLARFLNVIVESNILFQGKAYYVSKDVQKASVSINEEGLVSLFPSPRAIERMMFYRDGRNFLLFNDNVGVLERFVFASSKIGKVYYFFLENPSASPKVLGSLLLPYVEGAEIKEDSGSFKINLYIDLNERAELVFRTDYLVFGENKGESELKDNVYYVSRIAKYRKELENYEIPAEGFLKDDDAIIAFLKKDLTSLKKVANVFLSERLAQTKVSHVGKIDIHLERNVDWLSLKVKSKEFNEDELEKILLSYRAKKKFVLLRDKAILLDDPELKELSELAENLRLDERLTNDKIPLYEAFSLRSKEASFNLSYGAFVKQFIDDILSFDQKELPLDPSLAGILRPYQHYGVKWLWTLYSNKMGGILADDMGLGKTLETIAFLSLVKKEKPSLIIAPKSVLYGWQEEAKRFAPSLRVEVLDGSREERMEIIRKMKDMESDVFVVSYDSLRNDSELYSDISFETIICDEAQNIKNAAALRSKAIKRLKGSFHLALTGTPIENSMSDLWAIFDFLMPGYLRTLPIFKTTYVMAGNQEKARRLLSKRVQPFILRRTKQEVLKELPKKVTERVGIAMDSDSEAFYRATLQEAKRKKKEMKEGGPSDRYGQKKFMMLPILTKLREICVDPQAFFDGFDAPNAKLTYAVGLVSNALLGGHKVLIFSAFVKVLDHLESLLLESGIASFKITGDVSGKSRSDIVKRFNEKDERSVMLISLKAGGTGLNLQTADIVIHLDPWWNLASEEQATDRAYRIGQKRPVTVYKLYSRKSIEEKVLELQDSKKELYDSLIHSSSSFLSALSEDDLDFLLE